ncbi:MAG: hypothetical protein OEY49_08500 [Candidatus Heimdallarchaeota archaeon]|nr:hypothetical protein [Candidatus Heimdallarchaeota archaeon]
MKLDELSSVSYYAICRDILIPYKNKSYLFYRFYRIHYPNIRNVDRRLEWFLQLENGLNLSTKISLLEEETNFNSCGIGKIRFEKCIGILNINATKDEIEYRRLKKYDGIWALSVASFINKERGDLTVAELMVVGKFLANDNRIRLKLMVFTSLLARMGKIEIYFLASQINKFHDFISRNTSLIRVFSRIYNIERSLLEKTVSMHSMIDIAKLVEKNGSIDEFSRLIPFRTFKPMLAAKWQKKYQFPIYAEAKYDGIRLIIHKLGNSVKCYSRRRKSYMYKFPSIYELSNLISEFSVIIDGEMTAFRWSEDGPEFLNVYELHDSINKGISDYTLVYIVFDIIYLNGVELINLPYENRKTIRNRIIKNIKSKRLPIGFEIREVETTKVFNKSDLLSIYYQYINVGFEGAILKLPDSLYYMGKRDPSWQKLKPKEEIDVTITGIIPIQDLNSIRVWGFRYAALDKEEFRNLGMIRGISAVAGLRLAELIVERGLLKQTDKFIDLQEGIDNNSRYTQSGKNLGFEIIPDIVISIDSLGIVRKDDVFSLRNARFLHIREDKPVQDISQYQSILNDYMRSEG